MGWSSKFDEPIPLPNGKPLVTLRDAALYITKLTKANITARAGYKGCISEIERPDADKSGRC
jgi:hypothetical protein